MNNIAFVDTNAILSYLRRFGSYYVMEGDKAHMEYAQELIKEGLLEAAQDQTWGFFAATSKVVRTKIVRDVRAEDLRLNLDVFTGFTLVDYYNKVSYEGDVREAKRFGNVSALSTRPVYKNFWERLNRNAMDYVIDVEFQREVDGRTVTVKHTFAKNEILQIT